MDQLRYKLHKCLKPHRILAFALCYTLTCFVCLSIYYDGAYKPSNTNTVLSQQRNEVAASRHNQSATHNDPQHPNSDPASHNGRPASAGGGYPAGPPHRVGGGGGGWGGLGGGVDQGGRRRNISREILQLKDKAEELQREVDRQTAAGRRNTKIDWRELVKRDLFKEKSRVLSTNDYRHFANNESLSYHCGRCAIVSSSGQLLGRGAGPEIDRNECVIRMNDAPTRGYEADVGRRTSVRVIGHRNLGRIFAHQEDLQDQMFSNRSSERVFVHWSYLTDDIDADKVAEYAVVLKLMDKYPNVDFVMFTPQKMKFAEKLFHHETDVTRRQARTWLSTGWYTMLLAMDICDEINVYGMVSEDYCKDHPDEKVPYHYYDPSSRPECAYYHTSEVRLSSGHLFITEKAVFSRWAHIYNIRFRFPQWVPKPYSVSDALQTPFLLRYHIANNRLFSKYPLWKLYFHLAGIFYPLVH